MTKSLGMANFAQRRFCSFPDLKLLHYKQELLTRLNCYISHSEWELAYCGIKKLQHNANGFYNRVVCVQINV